MTTVILLVLTGLGLSGLYFLVASGLSLVFGLADVLNFAHGLFLSIGAYATWPSSRRHQAVGSHAHPPCQEPCRSTKVSPRGC